MLELSEIVVRYGTGRNQVTAADGVSLEVPTGKTTGLVGESGSGKSTIARTIAGLLPIVGGTMTLDGQDVTSARARNARSYRRTVQMVFQDPSSSLNPRMTVGQTIGEALAQRGRIRGSARRTEVTRVLQLVGVGASAIDRYPHQFSGGQRQRVAIARALAVQPQIVVLDEVTSALDVSVQATILNLLKELQRELGLSYIVISHDLSVVGYMSDVVAVMYLGRVVETARREHLFANPRHPYTQALMSTVPRFGTARMPAALSGDLPDPHDPPAGCRFHTRCPIGPSVFPERTICIDEDPAATADSRPHRVACHFAGEATGAVAVAQIPRTSCTGSTTASASAGISPST
jgi:peptide/nickel transport system ATP-binding protein